jgi:predicted secreted protein
LVVLLACLVAAFGGRAAWADEPVLVLSELDDGKTVNVSAAKSVQVKLAGNPTTGYSWVVSKVDGNALQQVGGVDYARGGGPGVGEGGAFLATFNVANVGKTVVVMEYRRSWEKEKPPAKTFTVTLEVVDKNGKPASMPSSAPATGPSTGPASAPSTGPASAPSTGPASAPTTAPTTAPVTQPATAPATAPSTRPTTAPATAPSAVPGERLR